VLFRSDAPMVPPSVIAAMETIVMRRLRMSSSLSQRVRQRAPRDVF
jgi:hypothetical protein